MKKRLTRLVPRFLKPALRGIYYLPLDVIDAVKGRDSMIPPRSMIFIGSGDFTWIGREFKGYFVQLGGLQSNERVLDVGCGIGRMAVPLTDYLSPDGEYWGFDIVEKGVDWCRKRISPKYANFHFHHSDVYNKSYNPKGAVLPQDYRFPFADGFFDFVFLVSVFTHMLPAGLENYVREISRVLRAGGRCLCTFFILNDEARSLIQSGRSALDFEYELEGCRTIDREVPEESVAYEEADVAKLLEACGLSISEPVSYGSWCGRASFLTFQDLIVASKS
jgi:SAM-dependent methyltransferase